METMEIGEGAVISEEEASKASDSTSSTWNHEKSWIRTLPLSSPTLLCTFSLLCIMNANSSFYYTRLCPPVTFTNRHYCTSPKFNHNLHPSCPDHSNLTTHMLLHRRRSHINPSPRYLQEFKMLTGVTMKRLATTDSLSKNSIAYSNPPFHAL